MGNGEDMGIVHKYAEIVADRFVFVTVVAEPPMISRVIVTHSQRGQMVVGFV